jgi:hypothetical protein
MFNVTSQLKRKRKENKSGKVHTAQTFWQIPSVIAFGFSIYE